MQTELIDVAMKAIAAHVAAPFKLRIAELEQQIQSGFTTEALAQEDRAERAEEDASLLRENLKEEVSRGDALEEKLEQARRIQGGMQKKKRRIAGSNCRYGSQRPNRCH